VESGLEFAYSSEFSLPHWPWFSLYRTDSKEPESSLCFFVEQSDKRLLLVLGKISPMEKKYACVDFHEI
jgi:hypothetical protein